MINTKKIIKIFRDRKVDRITKMELGDLGLLLDIPNKVFREVIMGNYRYVIPASAAVRLIISEHITSDFLVEQWINDQLAK